jgi:hypothetical protein
MAQTKTKDNTHDVMDAEEHPEVAATIVTVSNNSLPIQAMIATSHAAMMAIESEARDHQAHADAQ